MRALIFLITLSLVAWLGSPSPIDPNRWLINRPTETNFFRLRRSSHHTKGIEPGVKGHAPSPRERDLRKGEYMCGNKVCKLQPGEIPKGCNGICQYPVSPYH